MWCTNSTDGVTNFTVHLGSYTDNPCKRHIPLERLCHHGRITARTKQNDEMESYVYG
jgi:hypothetical protein